MIVPIIIAFVGYGLASFALLGGLANTAHGFRAYAAGNKPEGREHLEPGVFWLFAAFVAALVTRWLIGGAY